MAESPTTEISQTDPDSSQNWAAGQSTQRMRPGLYIVATPIGNLRDITLRALDILHAAHMVYCEDTRVTQRLLSAYGIQTRLERCDEHTESARVAEISALLAAGKIVALVSDAGTPGISDPGTQLVAAIRAAGQMVFPIPGANAAAAAISAAGIADPHFLFIGFLPARGAARRTILQDHKNLDAIIVLYEAPQRAAELLQDIDIIMGARRVTIARELTKLHEEFYAGTPMELLKKIDHKNFRGEVVVLIAPNRDTVSIWDEVAIDRELSLLLQDKKLKEAVADVTAKTGLSRKIIYARALLLNGRLNRADD